MSVASLARTTGVTGEPSSTRSRASCSPLDAEVSMMSTDSSRTRAVIASKYSWRERRRGGVWSGAMPAAATPKAMSASLASAMMKSSCVYPPAKIVASLRSSAFMVSLFPSVPQDDLAVIRFTTTRSDPGGSVDQFDDAPGSLLVQPPPLRHVLLPDAHRRGDRTRRRGRPQTLRLQPFAANPGLQLVSHPATAW